MNNFAKIILATDGTQVLFFKTNDEEGNPALCYVTEHDGVMAEMTFNFEDDSESTRDEAFNKASLVSADEYRAYVKATVEGE